MPNISVVMSVYNGEKYLREAIESILTQTLADFEFIIINDGSSDHSLDILKEFQSKDGRTKLISRQNRGLIYSLNEGVTSANGIYIARMDADDIALPHRLEHQVAYMKEHDVVLCGTWAECIDGSGSPVGSIKYPITANKIKHFALLHNPFVHPSAMFTKKVFTEVGGYSSGFRHIEDYEFWTRIVFKYPTANIPEVLLKYRLHPHQITRDKNIEMRVRGVIVRAVALVRFFSSMLSI